MRMERIWAMPNKWTFAIKPIAQLLQITLWTVCCMTRRILSDR